MFQRPLSVNGAPVIDRRDSYSQRLRAAAVRAAGAARELSRIANKLAEELDEVTAPHGIPVTELSDEDSMVRAIADIIPARAAAANGKR